jgi:hypothetical protein
MAAFSCFLMPLGNLYSITKVFCINYSMVLSAGCLYLNNLLQLGNVPATRLTGQQQHSELSGHAMCACGCAKVAQVFSSCCSSCAI